MGHLLQPGGTGRRARAYRFGRDRRARHPSRDRHRHRRLRAAASSSTPARGQFFAAWYTQPNVYGRPIAADGTPLGAPSLLAFNYSSYDGLGLSYNPAADAYFAVFHGRGREDTSTQISAAGAPDVEFDVTLTAAVNGNFNPRITSHGTRREWMMVTSSDFGLITAQRMRTARWRRRRPRRRPRRHRRHHRRRPRTSS